MTNCTPSLRSALFIFLVCFCSLGDRCVVRAEDQASSATPEDSKTKPFEDLLLHRKGYGANVTGGAGGELVIVDSLDFSQLKAALWGDQPRWIRFSPGLKGVIALEGHIHIGSNKTIDGRGADITLTAPDDCYEIRFSKRTKDGRSLKERRNLIVHNIKIIKVGRGNNCGQGLGIAYGAKDVWVDHTTFSGNGDESISTGKGGTNLTVSWCRFVDTDKAILLGWGTDRTDAQLDPEIRVTIHHNVFVRVNGRAPALRYGKVHLFNNYFDQWNWSCVDVTMGGQLFSERNVFGKRRWETSQPALLTSANQWSPKPGFIKSKGDVFSNGAIDGAGPGINTGKVEGPGYEIEWDQPDENLLKRLEAQAGWSEHPNWGVAVDE